MDQNVFSIIIAPLAQLAEQEALNFKVGGSSPSRGTLIIKNKKYVNNKTENKNS